MLANRRRDTAPERALRSLLHAQGLRYRCDHPIITSRRRVRVDIAFTRARLAVFVDGCFWHLCPEHGQIPAANRSYWLPKLQRNVERDREVDHALRQAGWTVMRFWEHLSMDDAAAAVLRTLRQAGDADAARPLARAVQGPIAFRCKPS
jgi:DNA mismatch endonuclease (patch repair protein)